MFNDKSRISSNQFHVEDSKLIIYCFEFVNHSLDTRIFLAIEGGLTFSVRNGCRIILTSRIT